MYLLIVNYTKPQDEVAQHIDTHAAWVKKYITENVFVLAGPNRDKQGGVIVAKSIDRARLDAILAEDSYVKASVANYQVIDFISKATTPELAMLTSY